MTLRTRSRLFLAIPLSRELRGAMGRFLDEFRPQVMSVMGRNDGVSWAPVSNLHVTIKFFGDVDCESAQRIVQTVSEYTREIRGCGLVAQGVGSFPGGGKSPRVLWVGCSGASKEMTSDVRGVDYLFKQLGWPLEKRPFCPHLTIARIRRPPEESGALTSLLDRFREEPFGAWEVNEWVLYRSELLATGAVYHAVHRFPLAW